MSKILREVARRLAEEDGVPPLRPGQRRPPGYYMENHYTGERRVPRGAVVDSASSANQTLAAVRRELASTEDAMPAERADHS
jgi:hypothetical protein